MNPPKIVDPIALNYYGDISRAVAEKLVTKKRFKKTAKFVTRWSWNIRALVLTFRNDDKTIYHMPFSNEGDVLRYINLL